MTKEEKETYEALKNKLKLMQESKKQELKQEEDSPEELEEEQEEIEETTKKEVPMEKKELSKEEIGDIIEGHIVRLTQLFQIYRGL
jgi:hypothetical protein